MYQIIDILSNFFLLKKSHKKGKQLNILRFPFVREFSLSFGPGHSEVQALYNMTIFLALSSYFFRINIHRAGHSNCSILCHVLQQILDTCYLISDIHLLTLQPLIPILLKICFTITHVEIDWLFMYVHCCPFAKKTENPKCLSLDLADLFLDEKPDI